MSIQTDIFAGGFADPVFQSQAVFHAIMDCMARPGTLATLPEAVEPPAPLSLAQGAIALTLADHDTPVHLCDTLSATRLPQWLAFHAGASVTANRADAMFAFVAKGNTLPDFLGFSLGSQEYPDRSVTLVLEIDALESGDTLVLTGPGIKDQTPVAPKGLPKNFLSLWSENRGFFPRGIDLILTAGSHILCLPRTTRIAKSES